MSLEHVRDESDAGEDGPPVLSAAFPLYTAIILASIATVFIAQIIFGQALDFGRVADEHSARAAGFDKVRFLNDHEYWRILTAGAVHGGLLHFVMNGYALLMFGRFFEVLSNRAHLALVFLSSVIGGGVLSLMFSSSGISVGASGGIVGLLGYLAIYAFRRRDFITPEFRRGLVFNIGFIFLYGLLLFDVIDNFGHLGGLLTGAIYGLIEIPNDPYTDPRSAGRTARLLGWAALLIFIAASILSILLIAKFNRII